MVSGRMNLVSQVRAQKNRSFSPDKAANTWATNYKNNTSTFKAPQKNKGSPYSLNRRENYNKQQRQKVDDDDDDDNNEEDDNREPSEAQLVLLCLDYLRDLRRSYSANRGDLAIAEGLVGDYITIAIWALSRSFVHPKELVYEKNKLHGAVSSRNANNNGKMDKDVDWSYMDRPYEFGNDAFFQPELSHLALLSKDGINSPSNISNKENKENNTKFKLTSKIHIPPLKDMENEFLYTEKPRRSVEELINSPTNRSYNSASPERRESPAGSPERSLSVFRSSPEGPQGFFRHLKHNGMKSPEDGNPDRSSWYEYEDAHYSNQHRFYSVNGLASSPLNLTTLVSRGLKVIGGKTRGKAEEVMIKDELFTQFVEAVDSKGFFDISEEEIFNRAATHASNSAFVAGGKGQVGRMNSATGGKNGTVLLAKEKKSIRAQINEERYRKVLSKYRSKLAANIIEAEACANADDDDDDYEDEDADNGLENVMEDDEEEEDTEEDESDDDDDDDEEEEEEEEEEEVEEHKYALAQYKHISPKTNNKIKNKGSQQGNNGEGGHVDIMQSKRQSYFRTQRLKQKQEEEKEQEQEKQEEEEHVENHDTETDNDDTYTYDDDGTIMPASVYEGLTSSRSTHDDDDITTKASLSPKTRSLNMSKNSRTKRNNIDDDNMSANITTVGGAPINRNILKEAERFKSLGNVQMQQKNFEQAQMFYTNALKLMPDGPTSHVYFSNRAAALLSLKKFREAVWDSERSLALKADYAKAHARLGLAYFLLEEYQEATDAYTMAVKFEPGNKLSSNYLEKSRKKYLSLLRKESIGGSKGIDEDDLSRTSYRSHRSHKSHHSDKRSKRQTPKNHKDLEGSSSGKRQKNLIGYQQQQHSTIMDTTRHGKKSEENYRSSTPDRNNQRSSTPDRNKHRSSTPGRSKHRSPTPDRNKHRSSTPQKQKPSIPDRNDNKLPREGSSSSRRNKSRQRQRINSSSSNHEFPNDAARKNMDTRRSSNSPEARSQRSSSKSPVRERVERPKARKKAFMNQEEKIVTTSSRKQTTAPDYDDDDVAFPDDYTIDSTSHQSNGKKYPEKFNIPEKFNGRRKFNSPQKYHNENLNTQDTAEQKEADRFKGEGNRQMSKKEYDKAIKSYSRALRLCPSGPNSHVYFSNRAAAMCYLERYEEAELDSERSLALQPEYGKAHARLGLSRYFLKDYAGAVEAYESALLYDPDNAASRSYLAKAKSKLDKARRGSNRHR